MNRRGFLGLVAGAASAFALDPEKLLWVPGAKTISIPKPGWPPPGWPPPWVFERIYERDWLFTIQDEANLRIAVGLDRVPIGRPLRVGDTIRVRKPVRFIARVG